MEWRHDAGVDDTEASPSEERGVRDDESRGEPEKEGRRHAAEEVSSSESDEMDVEDMKTEDEEELWRRVERDGFPRVETEECGRPGGFPREEDVDTTPGVWATPQYPSRDMGGRKISGERLSFDNR